MVKIRKRSLPLVYLECDDFRAASEAGFIDLKPVECCRCCHTLGCDYDDDKQHGMFYDVPLGEDYQHPVIAAEVCENWPAFEHVLTRSDWACVLKIARERQKRQFADWKIGLYSQPW